MNRVKPIMRLKFPFVLICISLTSVLLAQEELLDPVYFIKDSVALPNYETAYLVTEGDTLMTWQKRGNQTSVTYLNSKITKTDWGDSVQVCKQEGLMLDDFNLYCQKSTYEGQMLSQLWKNVNEIEMVQFKNRGFYRMHKSFSKGLLEEERQDSIGNFSRVKYLKKGIEYENYLEGIRTIYNEIEKDTVYHKYESIDSSYTWHKNEKAQTELQDLGEQTHVSNKTENQKFMVQCPEQQAHMKLRIGKTTSDFCKSLETLPWMFFIQSLKQKEIPTLLIFEKGELSHTFSGYLSGVKYYDSGHGKINLKNKVENSIIYLSDKRNVIKLEGNCYVIPITIQNAN